MHTMFELVDLFYICFIFFQMKMTPSLWSTYPRLGFIEITSWCRKYLVIQWWETSEQVRVMNTYICNLRLPTKLNKIRRHCRTFSANSPWSSLALPTIVWWHQVTLLEVLRDKPKMLVKWDSHMRPPPLRGGGGGLKCDSNVKKTAFFNFFFERTLKILRWLKVVVFGHKHPKWDHNPCFASRTRAHGLTKKSNADCVPLSEIIWTPYVLCFVF